MIVKNLFLLYFLKRLVTPFHQSKAFELGIIDETGKALKKIKDLKTKEERNAYTRFDILIFNLKRIIQKFPLGRTKLANITAALFLIKESKHILRAGTENCDIVLETLLQDYFERMDYCKLNEMAANVSSGGAIAGVSDDLKLKKMILDFDEDEDEIVDSFFRRKIQEATLNNKKILLNKPFKLSEEKYCVYAKNDSGTIIKFVF